MLSSRLELEGDAGSQMTVELSSNAVTGPTSSIYPFSLDATRREALLAGADGIATLGEPHPIDARGEMRSRREAHRGGTV